MSKITDIFGPKILEDWVGRSGGPSIISYSGLRRSVVPARSTRARRHSRGRGLAEAVRLKMEEQKANAGKS
jgi:hypothetical protein